MNELIIEPKSVRQEHLEQLRKKNREKYQNAYDGDSKFDLGAYLVNYCMEDESKGKLPDWASSFTEYASVLHANEHTRNEAIGFFGMPSKVKEGILIYIQEKFSDEPGCSENFSCFSDDFIAAGRDIKYYDLRRKPNGKLETMIGSKLDAWEQALYKRNSYNGGKLPYFPDYGSILLFSQLAAYMEFEVPLRHEDRQVSGVYIADQLLREICDREMKEKGIAFTGHLHVDRDIVIVANSLQNFMPGNRSVADSLKELFEHAPWQPFLKAVMEEFKEYFFLKNDELKIDVYAESGRG